MFLLYLERYKLSMKGLSETLIPIMKNTDLQSSTATKN